MYKSAIAGIVVLAGIVAVVPAQADGYRHGGGHYRYHDHGDRHHGHGGGAAAFVGGILLGAFIGHLSAPPRVEYRYAPPPVPLADCRPITGTGYVNGRLARFDGTGCYDAAGNLHVVQGSERFRRYLE